jgi:hypothetical protein
MKRYRVSVARERLADVLDEADRSGAVVIERRNVRYVIRPERPARKAASRPVIEVVDPSVAAGQWHWTLTPKGLRFNRGSRRG